jgi:hypothetical protein
VIFHSYVGLPEGRCLDYYSAKGLSMPLKRH